MEQQLNNDGNEFLWKLLANPADRDPSYNSVLQAMVNTFPQSGVLKALHASNNKEENLKHAAAYIDPAILHKLVNTDSLPVVKNEQIIFSDDVPVAERDTALADDEEKTEPVYLPEDKVEYFQQDIDDEIYDEIVSIEDINLDQITAMNKEAVQAEAGIVEESAKETSKEDYFIYDAQAVNGENEQPGTEKQQAANPGSTRVSKYNDEKMPYTFMWWLDKTRKDHAAIYQPYAVHHQQPKPQQEKNVVADELQQQYFESIFNLNTVDELEKNIPPQMGTPHFSRKEDKIIERFIQEEPQIKHPSGIKLDNENKAKKSAEDRDELVTETLARIYTEQMLYHKAISTYKKLMLKFPEKSLYFAGHIKQLEKKIN